MTATYRKVLPIF